MSANTSNSATDDTKIAMVREMWDKFAERFTATANKRVTLQCASQLHANLQLESARNVLEVAAGAGLGSLDIARRMSTAGSGDAKQQLTVTDLSLAMVSLAKETLQSASTSRLDVRVQEANGQDLSGFETGSIDRYVSNMCLHVTPDPDAMLREARRVLTKDGVAGFTIWGRPEKCGIFAIEAETEKELGLGEGLTKPNFALGSDLVALRARFAAAGFSRVCIWPYLCVLEQWSGEEYAKFQDFATPVADEDARARRFEVLKRRGDEWLARKGPPIGLEAYIIVAKA